MGSKFTKCGSVSVSCNVTETQTTYQNICSPIAFCLFFCSVTLSQVAGVTSMEDDAEVQERHYSFTLARGVKATI